MPALRFGCLVALTLLPCALRAETRAEMLDRLVRAYPQALAGHDDRQIVWRDGTTMPVDDGIANKPYETMLRNASILDQLQLPYPRGVAPQPAVNQDPGRFRNETFFKKMYGDCSKGEVQGKLVKDVSFGWGIVGRLNKGGIYEISQTQLSPGIWRITTLNVDVKGRMFFLNSFRFMRRESNSHFRPVSASLTYPAAIQTLLADPLLPEKNPVSNPSAPTRLSDQHHSAR